MREPVLIVEIVQPFCVNTFGSAPCTATGVKCFNTRATCRDTANFDKGALSLYFSRGNVADRIPGLVIRPSLVDVSTAPTQINLTGSNPDAQGLGTRAVCSIRFQDHPDNDVGVDPYVSVRGGDPLNKGTFWTKWLVRNKYRQNIQIKVYEGYAGQTLPEMSVRTYFLQSVDGPDAGGITMQGKDILTRVEERKAQAPVASPGELFADISAVATSFNVANAVEADYPASGTVRINDELMTYASRADNGSGGITLSDVVRGTDNSTAAAHGAEDSVQSCLRYTDEPAIDVLEDLLTTYAGVDPSWLDDWSDEFNTYLTGYDLTTLISEPTSVQTLVSEIQTQVGCYIWWDERAALVKFKAIRGIDAALPVVTDAANILPGFSITEKPRERASQVWFYYGLRDFTGDIEDAQSYSQLFVIADLESESDDLYGEASIRKIYSRWITSAAYAQTTASKISVRYVDVPRQAAFQMDAKDRAYWVGDSISIDHYLDVDEFGERRVRNWTIISAEEIQPGETVQYLAEDTTLYGRVFYVQAGGAANYTAGVDPFLGFIGNADGLLSDGTDCARAS